MTVPEPAVPPVWWSPSRGLIERFSEGAGAYYQARGRTARPELPTDAVRLVPYRIRSYWTSQHTWTDPDCIECGGEGAPCCEPPDYPYPGEAIYQSMPSANWSSSWAELTGYVGQAADDDTTLNPADLLAYLAELKHRALAPVAEWMRALRADTGIPLLEHADDKPEENDHG